MNEVTFVIHAPPIGKIRHRSMVLPNGMIHNYNTKKNTDYEKLVKTEFKKQCPHTYFDGEIEVIINAYFPIPKSWNKRKQKEALEGIFRPIVKPDVDNISKIVLDSLNGVAFDDDKSVTDLHIHKWYSNEPRVEVTIIGQIVRV